MSTALSQTVAEGVAFMNLIDGKPVDALSGERTTTSSARPTARCFPRSRPPVPQTSTAR